ncbi:DUF11 domain-containing protein [Methanobrevibacter filiformis]|uniref:DUF11 domain-containing protein n=1 Tax=Methanobrevibacter filiformis TaxID=55758 RepID=A0A166F0V2_9EURY|nr:DUF11 domain-containing protein [Methanobrevibacter filiformis]KZX17205.1 hypothetical protein MBFIL_02750 [Methanobrevibacter filiformis]
MEPKSNESLSKKNIYNYLTKIAIILVIFTLIAIITSGANATDISITSDSTDGINGAINNATDSVNTITLSEGNYNKSTDKNNNISFSNKSLNFTGNGSAEEVVIDGLNEGQLFKIDGSNNNIIFENLTFKNGNASEGGAIFISGENNSLTIIGCIFENNYGNISGAIYNNGSTLNIINSTFIENSGDISGAIYNEDSPNVLIDNSNFINNSASDTGGVIYTGHGNFSVSFSNFTNNSHIAIYINSTKAFINSSIIAESDVAIGLGFVNSAYDLDENILNNNNTIENNTILMIIEGNGNSIGNGTFNSYSTNLKGIVVSGFDNNFSNIYLNGFINALIFNDSSKNNIFLNSTFDKNEVAIVIYGSNNTISTSTVINSLVGLVLNGTNNSFIYNRIHNNTMGMENYGENNVANFNWWGRNNITDYYEDYGTNLSLDYYYVLRLSLNNTFFTENDSVIYPIYQNATLTSSFGLNSEDVVNNITLLPPFEVEIILKNSTGLIKSELIDLRSNNFSEDITLSKYNLNTNISASLDDENITLSINADIVNLTITNIVNSTSSEHNIKDNITYIITVTNNGITNVSNLYVTNIILDKDKLNFINYTATEGAYDYATGLWTIENLNSGEIAILEINVTIIAIGTIESFANVSVNDSDINDKNIGNNTSSISIDALRIPVTLTQTNITTNLGKTIKLESTLTDKNKEAIVSKSIKFYINGTYLGTNITNSKGSAYFSYTPKKTGILYYTSSFTDSSKDYASFNSSKSKITINKFEINLAIGLSTGYVGYKKSFKVKATYIKGKVANKSFTVYINGKKLGTYKTNSKGEFTFKTTPTNTSTKIQIKSAENSKYVAISKTYTSKAKYKSFTLKYKVKTSNSKLTSIKTKAYYYKKVSLSVKVANKNGKPTKGKYVQFYIGNKYLGKVKTNKEGIAILKYTPKKT